MARAAFPKGKIYMTMRDELGTIYRDKDFADLFTGSSQLIQLVNEQAFCLEKYVNNCDS